MDLKEIRELGEKTNRIIEIDRQLKSLQELANRLLKKDDSSLLISLEIEEKQTPGQADFMSHLIKTMIRDSLPKSVSASVELRSGKGMHLTMDKSYQMMILDAFTRALKQQQKDLADGIKVKTGTI